MSECKNALRELCSILLTLNIFISEDEGRQPNWLKIIARKYPGCLIGSGKDVAEADVKELQTKFNASVGFQSFGYQIRKSEAYGDSVIIVIPQGIKDKLKETQPTGLLEEYSTLTTNELNFG